MRRKRVIRFLGGAFLVGGFVGLVSGLAFGGGTDTAQPQAHASETSSATLAATGDSAPAGPMTKEFAQTIGANEMGQILVLVYRSIGSPESDSVRAPENLRSDIALLKSEGYYPVNVRDLASGNIDIPAGKSPVVITFDESHIGQYRLRDNGSADPDSAVGILQAAVEPGQWASRASFFCLIDVNPKDNELFGQGGRQQEKLKNLVSWGYEVGSHTVSQVNLKKASAAEVKEQLAKSRATLEELIGGDYSVTSLALPGGEYPEDESLLRSGEFDGIEYSYAAVLSMEEERSLSPFSQGFDPLRIPRLPVTGKNLAKAIEYFKENPEMRYISDGDPATVSAPEELDGDLGKLREDLGRPVIRY